MFDEKSFFGPGRSQLNVLGGVLQSCSIDPLTGFFRDGCCNWHPSDIGSHTVCARMTKDFLEFSTPIGGNATSFLQKTYRSGLSAIFPHSGPEKRS